MSRRRMSKIVVKCRKEAEAVVENLHDSTIQASWHTTWLQGCADLLSRHDLESEEQETEDFYDYMNQKRLVKQVKMINAVR